MVSLTRIHAAIVPSSWSTYCIDSRLGPLVSSILLRILLFEQFVLFLSYGSIEILIVIVVLEGILYFLLIEKLHTLLNLFAILVLPFTVCVVGVEIVLLGRLEWRFNPLVQ